MGGRGGLRTWGVLSGGAEREGQQEPEAPSDPGGRTSGGRGTSVPALPLGGGALSALERTRDRGQPRPWPGTLGRLLRPGSLGAWPLSPTLGGQHGERVCTPALERGCRAPGPHLAPAERPGAGPAARTGAGAPKGGLISFPRAAEVSAQCLSHLFKFYGAWLVAAGPRPGEEAGAGSGSLPRPRGGPHQAGRRSGPGRPDSAGRPAGEGGLHRPGPGGGARLQAPQVRPRPLSRLQGQTRLPPPGEYWGVCGGGDCWKTE